MEEMKIALVTPARDEIDNLPEVISSISAQTVPIDTWVICQNGSTDGTREYLADIQSIKNVRNLYIINLDTESPAYELGFKYSRIIKTGFDYVLSLDEPFDFIGILDSDCFLSPDYYEILLSEFQKRPKLGVLSGEHFDAEGNRLPGRSGFPRGNIRLWRSACLQEAGYLIGMSADALSAIRAEIRGWACDSTPKARAVTRDVGARQGQRYYGRSAYYRGETLTYSTLRAAGMALKSPRKGLDYFLGYTQSMIEKAPRTEDPEIIEFSQQKLGRLLKSRFTREKVRP